MKYILTILCWMTGSSCYGQLSGRSYFDSLLRAKYPDKIEKLDAVGVYVVNGIRIYRSDSVALEAALRKVRRHSIDILSYSPYKKCGYLPGVGTIYIFSKKEKMGMLKGKKGKGS